MQKYGLHGQPKCDGQEWGVPTKSIISKLLVNRDYKTWYQIKSQAQAFYLLVR